MLEKGTYEVIQENEDGSRIVKVMDGKMSKLAVLSKKTKNDVDVQIDNLDLNGDGKVDDKDGKIASKVMNRLKGKKKKNTLY